MNNKIIAMFMFLIFTVPYLARAEDPKVTSLEKADRIKINLPEVEKYTFKNGVKLYYLQDKNHSIINVKVKVDLGYLSEKRDESPLYSLLKNHIFMGGSQKYTPDQFDNISSQKMIIIDKDINPKVSSYDLKCIESDQEQCIDLFFDHLINPRFDSERFKVLIENYRINLLSRNESTMKIANREADQLFYGEDSALGFMYNENDLEKITINQLKKLHEEAFTANRMFVVATSSYELEDFIKILEPYVAQIPLTKKVAQKSFPENSSVQKGIYFIPATSEQSTIVLSQKNSLEESMTYAFKIAYDILVQSNTSRLDRKLKFDLGYVSWIKGDLFEDLGCCDLFIKANSRRDITVNTLREMLTVYRSFSVDPQITEEEFQKSVHNMIVSQIYEYDTPLNIAEKSFENDFFNKEDPLLDSQNFKFQTLDTVKKSAQTHFRPEDLLVLVVGDPSLKEAMVKEFNATVLPLDNE